MKLNNIFNGLLPKRKTLVQTMDERVASATDTQTTPTTAAPWRHFIANPSIFNATRIRASIVGSADFTVLDKDGKHVPTSRMASSLLAPNATTTLSQLLQNTETALALWGVALWRLVHPLRLEFIWPSAISVTPNRPGLITVQTRGTQYSLTPEQYILFAYPGNTPGHQDNSSPRRAALDAIESYTNATNYNKSFFPERRAPRLYHRLRPIPFRR